MPLVRSYYWRRDDDAARDATVTASAEDAAYPAVYLCSEDPAEPAKLTTTSGWWVVDLGSAAAVLAVALIYQYLDAGLTVAIQANASDSWGAPAFSTSLTIPAKRKDGPSYQHWTRNVLEVLSATQTYRYWRLLISGTNSQEVVVGRLLLLTALRPVTLYHEGGGPIGEGDDHDPIVHRTQLGVRKSIVIKGPQRSLTAVLIGTDLDAGTAPIQEAQDFQDLHEESEGLAYPFGFVPFGTEPWLVTFTESNRQRAHHQGGAQLWPFAVEEVSRGLPWP